MKFLFNFQNHKIEKKKPKKTQKQTLVKFI
jgi:hypothetical protein